MRNLLGVVGALAACWAGLAQGLVLEVSTYTPNPGAAMGFQVRGAPAGAQFRWDFDGDGKADLTTAHPTAQWTVPQGAWETVVEAVESGRVVGSARALIVADANLGASRTVRLVGGTVEVTISVRAKTTVIAPGIEESIPPGWVLVVLDDGGALYKIGETLQAIWPTILDPGWEAKLVYRLHPPAAGATARLSGKASGYVAGARVEVRIAGAVGF